jgi:hypothetical protein
LFQNILNRNFIRENLSVRTLLLETDFDSRYFYLTYPFHETKRRMNVYSVLYLCEITLVLKGPNTLPHAEKEFKTKPHDTLIVGPIYTQISVSLQIIYWLKKCAYC